MVSLRALGNVVANLAAELVSPSVCSACDEPVAPTTLLCPACATSAERVNPATTGPGWMAVFEYGGAIATAIARLKYEGRADLASRLGRSMLAAARSSGASVDLIVPVPLHPRRLAERGYNQSALLAAPIASALGARMGARALKRAHDTPHQASLDRERRLVNVAGVFATRTPASVRSARVLLVDDVRTTGATLEACTTALHEAGARSVFALVLARRA